MVSIRYIIPDVHICAIRSSLKGASYWVIDDKGFSDKLEIQTEVKISLEILSCH